MSGSDIAVHGNDPIEAATQVRHWLNAETALQAPGPSLMLGRFNDFMADNYIALKANGHSDRDIERLPVPDLMAGMEGWIDSNRR